MQIEIYIRLIDLKLNNYIMNIKKENYLKKIYKEDLIKKMELLINLMLHMINILKILILHLWKEKKIIFMKKKLI